MSDAFELAIYALKWLGVGVLALFACYAIGRTITLGALRSITTHKAKTNPGKVTTHGPKL